MAPHQFPGVRISGHDIVAAIGQFLEDGNAEISTIAREAD